MEEKDKADNLDSGKLAEKVGKEAERRAKEAQAKAKKVIKDRAKKGSLATALGPILFWLVVVIVIIIILIGIIIFFETMPGMVMNKMKALFEKAANYVGAFFGVDTSKQIKESDIFESLDYLEDMGYDLKGYGFLTDYYTNADKSDIEKALTTEEKADYKIDNDIGVVRRGSDGKVLLAKSDFIFTYIVSDNYIYTMRNNNLVNNSGSGSSGFWGFIQRVCNALLMAAYKINNFFFYRLNDLLGITEGIDEAWGRGMIRIYYERGFGQKGDLYKEGLFNFDTVAIDTNTKELVLANNGWFSSNDPIRYSLDGWVGRYGMPVEFLLSVHMATMMPDLAYDMATSFDTNVDVYIRNVEIRTGDGTQDAYTPYIAQVLRHWYRDVYYVIDLSKTDVNFVEYDYNYEKVYNERWTLYEVYTGEDKNDISGYEEYKKYASNNIGGFKLYIINDKGEYCTDSDIGDLTKNAKVFKDLKNTDYYVYIGSKEEAMNEGIYVTKKAIAIETSEDNLTNLNWNKLRGSIWSAYLLNERKVAYNKRGVSDASGAIRQTGEGLRTETNPTIKKMFLQNSYFRYNGTHQTAEIITAMRKKIKKDELNDNGDEFGALNELVSKGGATVNIISKKLSYTPAELGLNPKEFKQDSYSVNEFSGQVSLNQDSLNAFTMLENTHTLDADYIYRDFKELVVELGYFTKEELTDEIPKLLHWPVPEVASENYPYRVLDKRENEFGTAMHSKGDVLAKEYMDLDLKGLKENRKDLLRPKLEDRTRNELFKKWWNYKYSTILTKDVTPEDFIEKADEIWHYLAENEFSLSASNLADTFEEAKEGVQVFYQDGNYSHTEYNISAPTFISWALIELDTKFENYCSALSREMVDLGYDNPDGTRARRAKSVHNITDVAEVCVNKLNGEIIYEFPDLRPGDLIAFIESGKDKVTGLDILGKKDNGKFIRYSGNHEFKKDDELVADFDENEFYDATKYSACFGIRIFGEPLFNGYEGNEMVVSPVTGILLEYGTYDGTQKDSITEEAYRVNADLKYGQVFDKENNGKETAIDEKQIVSDSVGYAKILVLDRESYLDLERNTNSQFKNNSLIDENSQFREALVDDESGDITALDKVRTLNKSKEDARWSVLDQTIYTYKEYAESYEIGGISGYILYIDGFVCESPDELVSDVTKEIPYKTNGIVDQDRKDAARISTDDVTSNLKGLSYKQVTPNEIEDRSKQLPSKCIEPEIMTTSNTKINNKNEAETRAALRAANSIYLKDIKYEENGEIKTKSVIYIKEGTILGRTMTDKELLEDSDFRNGKFGTYEQNREFSDWRKIDGEDKIIGNYLRFILRDLDGTPVENVEDYMKKSAFSKEDWYKLYFYTPFPSGGTDIYMCGAEAIGSCTPGELGVGLVQETDCVYPYHNTDQTGSAIEKFLYKCWLMDPVLCAPLEEFFEYNGKQFWNFAEGGHSWGPWKAHGLAYVDPATQGEPMCTFLGTDGATKCGVKNGVIHTFNFEEDRDSDYDYIVYRFNSTTYVDPWGYLLVYKGGEFLLDDGYPQRLIDFDVYIDGGIKDQVSNNLRRSELQKVLSYICDVDREKFTQIQREVAKEIYLEADILRVFPWLADRPEALQCCIITILVSGSMSYEGWLGDHEQDTAPYEEILEQVSIDKSKVGSTLGPPSNDPTTGHAWTVPEIARRIMDGSLTKYDVEEWVRTGSSELLESCGVDFRKGNSPGYLELLKK